MPNAAGRLAYTDDTCGLPSAVMPRKIRTAPAPVSAMKMSPFGALRICRGVSRPLATKLSTLKPAGAFGMAFSGRLPGLPKPADTYILIRGSIDGGFGCGRSWAVILRAKPGRREAVLVNAFDPVITYMPSVLAA